MILFGEFVSNCFLTHAWSINLLTRLGTDCYGSLVPTIDGEQAFVPCLLPRELVLSPRLVFLQDEASRAVSTLKGVGETVSNPRLLIRPLLRREALLSSMIEGTVASLTEVFSHEVRQSKPTEDVREVINYVMALEAGIKALESLPISFRLVNQINERLLTGVRGEERHPGSFRAGQVWIGPPGSSIREARFVPPPPDQLRDLFLDWEEFANQSLEMPPLVRCAMMHYQFEAIHPYEDGNGRVGRLLITLYLIASGVLSAPLLYLSAYFERDRQRYYDELLNMSITGNWEQWLSYFLTGVRQEAQDMQTRIRSLRHLHDDYRQVLQSRRVPSSALQLLDDFFANPFMTVRAAANSLNMTASGASRVLDRLVDAGLVRRDTLGWPTLYVADKILDTFERPMGAE